MITDSFDNRSAAKINPKRREDAAVVDACIMTFSHVIEKYVVENFDCSMIGKAVSVNGESPIYCLEHNGKRFAFMKTLIGGPGCVGTIEDTLSEINADKYILFGGSGCLDREIAHGKVTVPTEAYRDEGTSYHYAPASDYIAVKNADVVAEFMEKSEIPFVKGRTWSTDAFYRETENNIAKRKADGCISVEMECASVQAMCDFKNLDVYYFLTSGDLLDCPKWDSRTKAGEYAGTQHDVGHFDIALALADYVTGGDRA